tara:strand:+ start:1879 stop:3516 length:1638 start_codon:yes stop_codon:yes gene_type:complete
MMETALRHAVGRHTKPINETIADGLAIKEMQFVEDYVDDIIRCAEKSFPEGLKYIDWKRLTPIEEFIRATEPRGSRSQFDVARNDVYMIQLNFEWEGEKIAKPIYLPFVRDGGMIAIRGSSFAISPVLADKGISLGTDSAFVQIPKAKITFKRTRHHFMAGSQRRTPNVVHSWLHNRDRKSARQIGKPAVTMETALVHYLFAKYGVLETFRHFNGSDIQIGDSETINEETHPSTHWVICSSIKRKPRGLRVRVYQSSDLRVAIRKEDFDTISEAMIAGLFYVVDHFPSRVRPEFIDGTIHETNLWRTLLGLIIGGVTGGEGAIREAMNEHMDSLDSYIDAGAKASLEQGDIYANDLYELIYHVLEILSQMVVQSSDTISTMYDKQLMVLRYVLRDINDGIFNVLFRLKNRASKKELTFTDVSKIIKQKLPTEAVLRMNNGGKHGEVNSVSSPGDNKFFKITSNLILQTDSGGNLRSAKTSKADKSKFLHASIAEVGSYGVLPKSEPTGRTRINPWVHIDERGSIVRDPLKQDLIDNTQKYIRRDD